MVEAQFHPKLNNLLNTSHPCNLVLSFFLLNRIRRKQGKYYICNNKFKSIALVVIFTVLFVYTLYITTSVEKINVIFIISSFTVHFVYLLQFSSALLIIAYQDEEKIRAYYENLHSIDKILFLSKYSAYERDKFYCKRMFFTLAIGRFVFTIFQVASLVNARPLFYMTIVDVWSNTTIDLHVLDYLVRVLMFSHRFGCFHERVLCYGDARRFPLGNNCKNLDDQKRLLLRCYIHLVEVCDAINDVFSIQMVLLACSALVSGVASVYSLLNFASKLKTSSSRNKLDVSLLVALCSDCLRALTTAHILTYLLKTMNGVGNQVAHLGCECDLYARDCNGRKSGQSTQRLWARLARLARRRPPRLAAAGLFIPDHSALATFVSVYTQLIIMLTQINK